MVIALAPDLSGRKARNARARASRKPVFGNPYPDVLAEITRVETRAPDGFGCDVEIVAECDGGFGGEHEPHLAVSLKFHQQHAAAIEGNACPFGVAVEQPHIALHAWGREALAIPDVLRKAADVAEAALKAEEEAECSKAA
jgi:hypothetical protein